MSLKMTIPGAFMVISGMALVILASFHDQVRVNLVLIVPMVVLRGPLGVASVILIFIGSALFVLGWFHPNGPKEVGRGRSDRPITHRSRDEEASGTIETSGILFLGPIPLIFGNSKWKESLPSWWVILLLGIIIYIFLISLLILLLIRGLS
jgi:uncharacterized protein (TIGR00304 family)